jgi:hypothetical protein
MAAGLVPCRLISKRKRLLPIFCFLFSRFSAMLPGALVIVIFSLRLGLLVFAQQVAVLFAVYGRDFAVGGHFDFALLLSDFHQRGGIFQLSFPMAFLGTYFVILLASEFGWKEGKKVYTYACISSSS